MADPAPVPITVINQRTASCLVFLQPGSEAIQLKPGMATLLEAEVGAHGITIEVHEHGGIDINANAGRIVAVAEDVDSRERFLGRIVLQLILALVGAVAVAWIAVAVLSPVLAG